MPDNTTAHPSSHRPDDAYIRAEMEDEISLIDLWLVLVKNKKIILIVMAFCITLGIGVALTTPQQYRYGTTISIGYLIGEQGSSIIDSPENVLAKINETYIPLVLNRYQAQNSDDQQNYTIDARIPKDSKVIVMESQAPEELESTYLVLHEQVVQELGKDHNKMLDVARRNIQNSLAKSQHELEGLQDPILYKVKKHALELELEKAQLALEELKDPRIYTVPRKELEQSIDSASSRFEKLQNEETFIQGQHERLETQIDLLTKEIKELSEQISTTLKQKSLAVNEVNDEAKAMTLLLLDNTIQQNRNRLSNLEQQLYINIPERSSQLNNALDENRKAQEITRKEIDTLKAKLERLIVNHQRDETKQAMEIPQQELAVDEFVKTREREIQGLQINIKQLEEQLLKLEETRALAPPMRIEATGTGSLVIVALATILGGMLGIFAAFFNEFLRNAQSQLKASEESEAAQSTQSVSPDTPENPAVISVKKGRVA